MWADEKRRRMKVRMMGSADLQLQEVVDVRAGGVSRENFRDLPVAIEHVGFGMQAQF